MGKYLFGAAVSQKGQEPAGVITMAVGNGDFADRVEILIHTHGVMKQRFPLPGVEKQPEILTLNQRCKAMLTQRSGNGAGTVFT
jgi:hypothetical protein